jgi:hypothetical protein
MLFSVLIQKIDPFLDAITIGTEVTHLDANIDGTEVSLRSVVAPTWQGSTLPLLAPTLKACKRPLDLGSCVNGIYIYIKFI